jgi:hypothetical protein
LCPEALNGSGAFMQEFFDDVEVVKENIVAIRNATTRVGEINQQVRASSLEDIRNLQNKLVCYENSDSEPAQSF